MDTEEIRRIREGDLVVVTDSKDLAFQVHGIVTSPPVVILQTASIRFVNADEGEPDTVYRLDQLTRVIPVKVQLSLMDGGARRHVMIYNEDRSLDLSSLTAGYAFLRGALEMFEDMGQGRAKFHTLITVDEKGEMQFRPDMIPDQGW